MVGSRRRMDSEVGWRGDREEEPSAEGEGKAVEVGAETDALESERRCGRSAPTSGAEVVELTCSTPWPLLSVCAPRTRRR